MKEKSDNELIFDTKKEKYQNRKAIFLLILLFIILVSGITYAFFNATVSGGDESSSIMINTATLGLKYSENPITCASNGIMPGASCTHDFFVENTGSITTDYYVYLTDVLNTFTTKEDLVYTLTCQSVNTKTGLISGTCSGKDETLVPSSEKLILHQNIDKNLTNKYTITITFKETGINQNDNQGKIFKGKILVVKEKKDNVIVDLEEGMIPVAYDEGKTVVASKTNINNSWYDYENQKWANIVLVTDSSRNTYVNASPGTLINEPDILGYFVYVPRYKYQLWNTNNEESNTQEIVIEFESKEKTKSMGNSNGEWLTHPAFTFGNTELNGIWVGKFETSSDTSSACYIAPSSTNCNVKTGITPRVVANVDSWRIARVSTFFDISRMFKNNSMYGISMTSIDSHMIKNSEWGAVAYLSNSEFGKYGNTNYTGANKEIYINNYQKDTTSYITTTGCSAGVPSEAVSKTCAYAFPSTDLKATGASTTGTIYGIYDMSGGALEYVMGNMVNLAGAFQVSAAGAFTDGTPDNKYFDSYEYEQTYTTYIRGKLGDATREIIKTHVNVNGGWNSDYSRLPYATTSWFVRGGYTNYASSAGIFYFNSYSGNVDVYVGSRVTIVIE